MMVMRGDTHHGIYVYLPWALQAEYSTSALPDTINFIQVAVSNMI
jgi:hypothetical protein